MRSLDLFCLNLAYLIFLQFILELLLVELSSFSEICLALLALGSRMLLLSSPRWNVTSRRLLAYVKLTLAKLVFSTKSLKSIIGKYPSLLTNELLAESSLVKRDDTFVFHACFRLILCEAVV